MPFHKSEQFLRFKAQFKGIVVLPDDSTYKQAVARWSTLAQREAGAIAYPKDVNDVSLAIQFAVDQDLELAIRGGGHGPSAASSTNGGLVIDLSKHINTVKVDPEKQVVHVDGGAVWRDVDAETLKHGLATVTGAVNHVGVGGLALGGGFGWLSGQYGTVVDNMLGATVVIANGTIVHCTRTKNADLLFAIRGGGSNFGVVTSFELQCYPQRPTAYCGLLSYSPDKLQSVFDTLDKWEDDGFDPKSAIYAVCAARPLGDPEVVVAPFYNGSAEEGRAYYKRLFDIGPVMDTTAEQPYAKINEILNPMSNPGHNRYDCGSTRIHRSGKFIAQTWANQAQHLQSQPELGFGLIGFVYFTLPSFESKDMAFNRHSIHWPFVVEITWDGRPDLVTDAREWAKDLIAITRQGADDSSEIGYANWETEVLASESQVKKVFGNKYHYLQHIKAKYDPNMVFNKWFPIVPAGGDHKGEWCAPHLDPV